MEQQFEQHLDEQEKLSHCDSFKEITIKDLQGAFLAIVFREAEQKLYVFQRGQRWNSFNYKSRKNGANANKPESSMSAWKKEGATQHMPSAKVLNEIKLDRHLEMLIAIYVDALATVHMADEDTILAVCRSICSALNVQCTDEVKEEQALQALSQNKDILKALQEQIDSDLKLADERLRQQQQKLDSLRLSLRSIRQVNDLELDLIIKWEENRYTQATIVGAKAELLLRRKIANYQQRIVSEQCCIREAMKFQALQFAEYGKQIAQWQQKFNTELASHQTVTRDQDQRIFELRKLHERQQMIYEQRVQYVSAYLTQKAEEQRLLAQEIQRVQSAVSIQAWWRGIMVRCGLGPFRKKSKKSKKKSERK